MANTNSILTVVVDGGKVMPSANKSGQSETVNFSQFYADIQKLEVCKLLTGQCFVNKANKWFSATPSETADLTLGLQS